MSNQKQEFNQSQDLALTAKYTKLNKYEELSDIELSIVAGGGGSATTCQTATDCPRSGAFLPPEMFEKTIGIKTVVA
jgi:hypothetical protein